MELFNAVVFVFLVLFCLLALAFILEAATAHKARAENRRLFDENEELKTDTLELAAKYLALLDEVDVHREQAASLVERNRALFIHNRRLEEEYERLTEQDTALNDENCVLKRNNHNLLNAVCEAEEQADRLYNDVCRLAEVERQNDELRERLATARKDIENYLEAIEHYEENVETLINGNADLEAEISALNFDLEEALQQVEILEDTCAALQDDLEDALFGFDEDDEDEDDEEPWDGWVDDTFTVELDPFTE